MAPRINQALFLAATALGSVGCQSITATKAMNPTVVRDAAMRQAQAEAFAAHQIRAANLAAAEAGVAASPDDVGARRTLAHAYFASGRFRSAAQAYDDALAIVPGDESLRLRKALALLAQGNQVAAVGELDRIGSLPDAGLAYALAGQGARGIQMLTNAARHPDATARTRQNLALAYALNGQWAQARVIATQDLDPTSVELRIREWAELAILGDVAAQTASLLAVAPVTNDVGRPTGLAYVPREARPLQAAVLANPPVAAQRSIRVAAATLLEAAPAAAATAEEASPKPVAPTVSAPPRAPAAHAPMAGNASATAASAGTQGGQAGAFSSADAGEASRDRLPARRAGQRGEPAAVRSNVMIGSRRFEEADASIEPVRPATCQTGSAVEACRQLSFNGARPGAGGADGDDRDLHIRAPDECASDDGAPRPSMLRRASPQDIDPVRLQDDLAFHPGVDMQWATAGPQLDPSWSSAGEISAGCTRRDHNAARSYRADCSIPGAGPASSPASRTTARLQVDRSIGQAIVENCGSHAAMTPASSVEREPARQAVSDAAADLAQPTHGRSLAHTDRARAGDAYSTALDTCYTMRRSPHAQVDMGRNDQNLDGAVQGYQRTRLFVTVAIHP